jgi:colanic acid/amylovoran biosynthesis glycosyltransferase
MTATRIGIFVVAFPRSSETFIVTKVLGLLDAGFDIQIFVTQASDDWDRFASLDLERRVRGRVHLLPAARPRWRALLEAGRLFVAKLASHPIALVRFVTHNARSRGEHGMGFLGGIAWRLPFVGSQLDVLHVEFDVQGVALADLKRYLGCRLLLSARGTAQRTGGWQADPSALPHLMAQADGYHFISRFLQENTHRLGYPRHMPAWLIAPAIDTGFFQPDPASPADTGKVVLISVGRLAWAKGYEFALDAVAKVVAAGIDVEYLIVGEGPYEEAIRFAADQLGLLANGTVRMLGGVSRQRVRELLGSADIMVHAALEEGFCNAVLEAQAMGLPVVTSDAGGLPENVDDGVSGFVVRRRDSDAMSQRLLLLARDRALRSRMGAAGRERVVARFAIGDQVRSFAELYRALCAGSAA